MVYDNIMTMNTLLMLRMMMGMKVFSRECDAVVVYLFFMICLFIFFCNIVMSALLWV